MPPVGFNVFSSVSAGGFSSVKSALIVDHVILLQIIPNLRIAKNRSFDVLATPTPVGRELHQHYLA